MWKVNDGRWTKHDRNSALEPSAQVHFNSDIELFNIAMHDPAIYLIWPPRGLIWLKLTFKFLQSERSDSTVG